MKRTIAISVGALALLSSALLLIATAEMKSSAEPSPNPNDGKSAKAETDGINIDWNYWNEVNPDVIAWLEIPTAEISLPIAKASQEDPTYYLSHDAKKASNIYGCAYLDASCSEDGLEGRNALILGHHMNDGSMFSKLANEDFLKSCKTAYLHTSSWTEKIILTKAERVNANTTKVQTSFSTWESYEKWFRSNIAKGKAGSSTPLHAVTLATCSYGLFENERTLVYGYVSNRTYK